MQFHFYFYLIALNTDLITVLERIQLPLRLLLARLREANRVVLDLVLALVLNPALDPALAPALPMLQVEKLGLDLVAPALAHEAGRLHKNPRDIKAKGKARAKRQAREKGQARARGKARERRRNQIRSSKSPAVPQRKKVHSLSQIAHLPWTKRKGKLKRSIVIW